LEDDEGKPSRKGCSIYTGHLTANGMSTVDAVLPVARVRSMQNRLPGLSMGEGILESRPGGYQPIGDNPPKRERSTAFFSRLLE
jgi:hypothetical protein